MLITFGTTPPARVARCTSIALCPQALPDGVAIRSAVIAATAAMAAELGDVVPRPARHAHPLHQDCAWYLTRGNASVMAKVDVGYQARKGAAAWEIVHLSLLLPGADACPTSAMTARSPDRGCSGCRECIAIDPDETLCLLRTLLPEFQALVQDALHMLPRDSAIVQLFNMSADAVLGAGDTHEDHLADAASTPRVPQPWPEPSRIGDELHRLTTARGGRAARNGAPGRQPLLLLSLKRRPLATGWHLTNGRRFGLTARECAVAAFLMDRRSNREIATVLGISPRTAAHHTEQVLVKVGVHSRAALRDRLAREPLSS